MQNVINNYELTTETYEQMISGLMAKPFLPVDQSQRVKDYAARVARRTGETVEQVFARLS